MFCYTVCEGVGRLYFISEQEHAEWPGSILEYHSGTQVVDGCEVVYTQVSKEYNLNSVNGEDRHRCAKACILLGVLLAAQYEANYFGHQTMIEKLDPSRRLKTQVCIELLLARTYARFIGCQPSCIRYKCLH